MTRRRLRLLIPPLLAGLWGAALGIQHLQGDIPFLGRVEATMTDMRVLLRGERPSPKGIAIVAIDDELVRKEGAYPIGRATIARIVDAVAARRPSAIGLDMLLIDPGPDDGDMALARSLRQNRATIAAAAVFADRSQSLRTGDSIRSDIPTADSFLLPQQRFAEAAAIGMVNIATDQTGAPRSVPMLFTDGKRIELSFALRVAARAAGVEARIEQDGVRLGERFIVTDLGHTLPLAFFGPHGTIRTISAATLLDGTAEPPALAGQIVVIGVTVTGSGDVFPSPFDQVLPGAEAMATAISHLTNGDGLVRGRPQRIADAAVAVFLPMLIVGLIAWRRSLASFMAIIAVLFTWTALNVAAFVDGSWFSAALPMAAAVPPAILFGAVELWRDRRRAQHYASQSMLLQHVHAAGFSEWLAANPDFLSEPVRQDAAILFIDMTGFTALSETIGPDSVRELLDGFYRLVDEEAVAGGGAITSFAGDGAMLLFGLPQPTKSDALNAANCCAQLSRRTREWLATLEPTISSLIRFKMGVHFGPIVASRLGGERNQQITATGDTVNVASRLMEVAADRGGDVAVSKKLLDNAGPECALLRQGVLSGQIESRIRGRTRLIAVRVWWDS